MTFPFLDKVPQHPVTSRPYSTSERDEYARLQMELLDRKLGFARTHPWYEAAVSYFFAVWHNDFELGALVQDKGQTNRLNDYLKELSGDRRQAPTPKSEEAPIRVDMRKMPSHTPCKGPYEPTSEYQRRIARLEMIEIASRLAAETPDKEAKSFLAPVVRMASTISEKVRETIDLAKELTSNLSSPPVEDLQASTPELRPGDLADLPAKSRRYLIKANRVLLRLARSGNRLKYKRTASFLGYRSKSLSVWAALQQIKKDGAIGSGPDLRTIPRSALYRFLRNMSAGPQINKLLERRSRKVIWLIKDELAKSRPRWFPPFLATKSYIPKPNTDELRPLTFPAMIDRARETKILFIILPQARIRYNVDESVGFWPNMDRIRGMLTFLSKATTAYGIDGYDMFSVDVAKYFGSIPEVARREMTAALWIATSHKEYIVNNMIMPYYDTKDRKFHLWEKGKASSEGSVLLPTLANMYLFKYDGMLKGLGVVFCRYADNMVFALPKAGLRHLPWHLEASEFLNLYIQPHMPPGVRVHDLSRPEKTHII